jgi:hypothetical protein
MLQAVQYIPGVQYTPSVRDCLLVGFIVFSLYSTFVNPGGSPMTYILYVQCDFKKRDFKRNFKRDLKVTQLLNTTLSATFQSRCVILNTTLESRAHAF